MGRLRHSDAIREMVSERYVKPALRSGQSRFSISVGEVRRDAKALVNFPDVRSPVISKVLRGQELLETEGLTIERVDVPTIRPSRKVVVHYRVVGAEPNAGAEVEDSAAWAKRLTGQLDGLLRDEIAAFGGADALIRWIRSDPEEEG